ncbi:hypothetical protein [Weissella paramesenteroides]|uniref:hypothetical protein n=1 Tax=Weissella paramesenteroides TaxID=1249 RepID=UPI0023F80828|nr:hypothetical protein [Weissella paramesenteroides]MDF8372552.1 hypothetical protein [Weissella paramesenteroides]WIG66330.1 hypothetical protein G9U56_04925 [Weissella paramesenteroides]
MLSSNDSIEEIQDDLIRKIENMGFDCVKTGGLAQQLHASLYPNRNVLILNEETITVFDLEHEIIHIEEHHNGRILWDNGNDERNYNEAEANKMAISRILSAHCSNGWSPNYYDIMFWYGIPYFLENEVKEQLKNIYGNYFGEFKNVQ